MTSALGLAGGKPAFGVNGTGVVYLDGISYPLDK
jgi:hypothetical protein